MSVLLRLGMTGVSEARNSASIALAAEVISESNWDTSCDMLTSQSDEGGEWIG